MKPRVIAAYSTEAPKTRGALRIIWQLITILFIVHISKHDNIQHVQYATHNIQLLPYMRHLLKYTLKNKNSAQINKKLNDYIKI